MKLWFSCLVPLASQGRPLSDAGIDVSRDGFHFSRVKNGERVLPLGPPGAWDSGYIFPMNPMLLTVNLEGLATLGAAFFAEVLNAATGCVPPADDGLAVPLSWKGGATLPEGRDLRLRFHLQGRELKF